MFVTEKILKSDMHKNGKWLFRKHTSCDGDGDGEGDGDDDCEGDGDDDGEGDGDDDGEGDVDIDESLKKNKYQDHIIRQNCLSITLWGQKCGREAE